MYTKELTKNFLPCDGSLFYLESFIDSHFLELLINEIKWEQSSIRMFGKDIPEPRLTAWYADKDVNYTYSGRKNIPNEWSPTLFKIKEKVEKKLRTKFNGVLLNYYRDGNDYMGWHCDNEKELGTTPLIASISLGEERIFQLRHKKKNELDIISITPKSGSLIIMQDETQLHWKHRIAKTTLTKGHRINLTFRYILD